MKIFESFKNKYAGNTDGYSIDDLLKYIKKSVKNKRDYPLSEFIIKQGNVLLGEIVIPVKTKEGTINEPVTFEVNFDKGHMLLFQPRNPKGGILTPLSFDREGWEYVWDVMLKQLEYTAKLQIEDREYSKKK